MKRFVLAILALALAAPALFAADPKFRRSTRPAKGHYIVMLEPTGGGIDVPIQALVRMHGGEVMHIFRGAPWEGYSVKNLPEAAALALSRDPRVKAVEEDGIAEPLQFEPPHSQWALDRTNQRSCCYDNVLSAGCVGTSMVHIYIMDTGINDPNGVEFGTRLIHGYKDPAIPDFVDRWGTYGHGTPVASIAGGITYGTATGAKIVNVKVVESGDPNNVASRAAAAIRDYINGHPAGGPKVVNISQQWPPTDSGLSALDQEILHSVSTYNITYVAGAGNSNNDACALGSPSRLGQTNGVIVVSGTYLRDSNTMDARGRISELNAAYGPCVDIFAPGADVAARSRTGSDTNHLDGTSLSSPQVAGAAARRQAVHWNSYPYNTIMPPAEVEAAIKSDATPNVIYPDTIGTGSPNLLLYRFYLKCRAVG